MKPFCIAFLFAAAISLVPTRGVEPLVSPEILPDHRVIFRVRAAKAAEVGMWGDWMTPKTLQSMSPTGDGVWSVTLGPLDSGPAIYTVTVDGVTTPDPVNPRVKLRARTSASILTVPGNSSDLWEARDVPHGALEVNWSRSDVLRDTRSYIVYTPPGYDPRRSKKYPVLYLLHGSNDTAAGWTDVGKANFILDNLLAAKGAVPMLVVMPWGHAVPFDGPQTNNTELFERYLLDEIIPQVERKYRVATERHHRAIVGLSMGGGQALQIGFEHLELFSSIGAFSSAVPSDFSGRFQALLKKPDTTNHQLDLLWIGCGRQDSAFERNRSLSELLTQSNIHHTFYPTEGLHNFALWRRHLAEVVPLLFRGR